MTSERECYVYLVPPGSTKFVTAGRFRVSTHVDGHPVGQFVYGRTYLSRSDAVELDPVELRLKRGPYETVRLQGFFGAIRDAMPDHWGRRVIERAIGRGELEEFDYLMHAPDDRSGALGFGYSVEPTVADLNVTRSLDIRRLQAAADAILNDNSVEESHSHRTAEELMLLGTSMGGARPKVSVEHEGEIWLAKLSKPTDRWNHPRVEAGMLELARVCGLDVAESQVVTVGDQDVLLVRRFDRHRSGGSCLRHRMVSAVTLLQCGDDVTSRARWSYLMLADEVRRASARPEEDLRELFTRMCFNAAVSNLDDHPRNHAMLAIGTEWRLSPAYDLTPSRVVSTEVRDLAMICGRFGRFANRANLLSHHERFLLSANEAETTLNGVVEKVRKQWREVMESVGVTDADQASISNAFLYEGFFHPRAR